MQTTSPGLSFIFQPLTIPEWNMFTTNSWCWLPACTLQCETAGGSKWWWMWSTTLKLQEQKGAAWRRVRLGLSIYPSTHSYILPLSLLHLRLFRSEPHRSERSVLKDAWTPETGSREREREREEKRRITEEARTQQFIKVFLAAGEIRIRMEPGAWKILWTSFSACCRCSCLRLLHPYLTCQQTLGELGSEVKSPTSKLEISKIPPFLPLPKYLIYVDKYNNWYCIINPVRLKTPNKLILLNIIVLLHTWF